jgi:multisubunit Na+/H+ antiporter MnhG subunit
VRAIVTDILLGLTTLAVWLSCLGFLRLRAPLDRLHAASFAGVAVGPLILLATGVAQGANGSFLKVLFLVVTMLLSGATLSHAAGRAIHLRDRQGAGSV